MRSDGRMKRGAQVLGIGVVVAAAVAFALPLGDDATALASNLATFITGLLMIAALGTAVRDSSGVGRTPWLATLAVYAVGMATYALDPSGTGGDYPAAVFFGPFATAAQLGVVAAIARKLLSELRSGPIIVDAAWLAGSILLIAWNIIGAPITDDTSLQVGEKAILLAQIGFFACLVGFLCALLPHTDRAGRRALLVLSSPALLLAIALTYQARSITQDLLAPGSFSDFLFPLAFGFGAAAVLELHVADRIRADEQGSRRRPLLVASLPLVAWITTIALGELNLAPQSSLLGLAVGIVAVIRVSALVTDNSRLVADLAARANHDHLTGLPNRAGLEDILARLGDGPITLLLVDLDRFKLVNDTLGHRAGDSLLAEASRRMAAAVGEPWTVTRLAGDEFVIIGRDDGAADLEALARSVISSLSQSFVIGDRQAWVSATVGIASTRDDLEAHELLEAADDGLRRAKAKTRGGVSRVGTEYRSESAERVELETALRLGIDRDELFCLYQPKVDLASGRILGVEALVRWNRPGHGVVPPHEFIGVAEASGLIARVDEWVFDAAIRQLNHWNTLDGERRLSLSVNMSAWQLSRVDVHESVARTIARSGGVDPDQITMEITETALIEAPDVVAPRLRRLRDLGVHLSIDDFGVGFTAIAYLVDFPVDEVKLDRTLVDRLNGGREDERSLAAAVIALARAMDLEVVAEGVETTDQVAALRRLGCEKAQGFHFAKPLPAEQIDRLLLERDVFMVPDRTAV